MLVRTGAEVVIEKNAIDDADVFHRLFALNPGRGAPRRTRAGVPTRLGGLLDDVRQLVGEQAPAFGLVRSILFGSEVHVPAVGERARVDASAELGRSGVSVNANVAEITSEA
jgi:hypothetical protein